jgi:hypothetical protein
MNSSFLQLMKTFEVTLRIETQENKYSTLSRHETCEILTYSDVPVRIEILVR